MIKKAVVLILVFAVGLSAGVVLSKYVIGESGYTGAEAELQNTALIERAYEVAGYLKNHDYEALAGVVSPQNGVIFVPLSTIVPDGNKKFSASQVGQFANDKSVYVWGVTDGKGDPISLTPVEYIDKYVYNRDYISVRMVGINAVLKSGNSLENVTEIFPNEGFVEFHFPGIDPALEGIDWSSLKLVFEERGGTLYLVAVIHSEWTV